MTAEQLLLIILYLLGSILLVVLIILGIKLINTMNKIQIVVDDINKKVDSFDGLFSIIDTTTDKLAFLSDKMVDGITVLIKKILKPKKGKEEIENEQK